MQKKHLELAYTLLSQTELNLAEARIRDTFIKELSAKLESFYEEKKKIIETLADKDENGAPIIQGEMYKMTNMDTFNQELNTLLSELVSLEVSDQVKNIIRKTNYKPKVGEMELIDEILA